MVPTAPFATALDCPVCLDMFRDPRMLPACGHSICWGCVQQLMASTTSVGNVVCPECRGLSQVTEGGFPKNYKLAEIVSTMDAAGYRQTSQCCGCRSQVPNRKLHWCLTCATEDPVVLCADCALLCHKDHYLTPYTDTCGTGAATLQASRTAKSPPTAVVIDISEIKLLVDASERRGQANRTFQPSIRTGAARPGRCASCRGHLKAVVLVVFKLIFILIGILGFITATAWFVLISSALFGPIGVVVLLSLMLVSIAIAACCRRRRNRTTEH